MQYIKRTRWLSSVFLCFSILILYIVNILIEGKEDTQQIFSPDPFCYAHPSYILMTRNFLKTQKLLDPSSSQLSGNWFEQEPDKFSPWCQTRSFSILHSNDVSRFPIVSIQVKFHSCPVWSSVIWLYAWMDSSLMKCGTELAKVFTIFNKGRISRCAQIFFYGWNSNRVLFEVFSTAKSNSVLFWTTSNSLTTCAHTQNKLSIFCGIFQAILFIKAYLISWYEIWLR